MTIKKAVLIHGTDGGPEEIWLPWMTEELKSRGYEVFAPTMPNNHTPNRKTYENFLRQSGWDFTDNVLVGHSSGATTILNLLSSDWFPRVNTVVLAGTFLNEKLLAGVEWYEPGQFDNLFLEKYDSEVIKAKANNFVFVHGSNDPYCDIDDARELCEKLNGEFITIENGLHLSSSWCSKELPGLFEKIEEMI